MVKKTDNPGATSREEQRRFKPLGSKVLLGLAIAAAGSIFGATWSSMNERFGNMEARFGEVEKQLGEIVSTISNREAVSSQLISEAFADATKEQYAHQIDLLQEIEGRLRAYDENARLEIERLESAIFVSEAISEQRLKELGDQLDIITDLILPASGPR